MTILQSNAMSGGRSLVVAKVAMSEELGGFTEPAVIEKDGYLLYATKNQDLRMDTTIAIFFEEEDTCRIVFKRILEADGAQDDSQR